MLGQYYYLPKNYLHIAYIELLMQIIVQFYNHVLFEHVLP